MKEVDIAIVADMGTLQRLPGIIGEGAQASRDIEQNPPGGHMTSAPV